MKENRKWTRVECWWNKLSERQHKLISIYAVTIVTMLTVGVWSLHQ